MEGSEFFDEWVICGNYYDGWNHGVVDLLFGMIVIYLGVFSLCSNLVVSMNSCSSATLVRSSVTTT